MTYYITRYPANLFVALPNDNRLQYPTSSTEALIGCARFMPFLTTNLLLLLWLTPPLANSSDLPDLPPPPPPPLPPAQESPAAISVSPLTSYIKQGRSLGMPANALLLIVDVGRQQLTVIESDHSIRGQFIISTASAGVGNRDGSNRTPLGWHKIDERIGAMSPPGEVFVGRVPQKRPLKPHQWRDPENGDFVLTRIMWLRGLEPGINVGPGIDTHERYIYFHGTNQEHLLGQPSSDGCIRMSNRDVMELFDWVGKRETWCLIVSHL